MSALSSTSPGGSRPVPGPGGPVRARVRIPADTDREDRLVAGLTARQLAIVSVGALLCWLVFAALRHRVDLPVLGAVLVPLAGLVCFAALGRVEGTAASTMARLALRQLGAPRRLVVAPNGIAPAPAFLGVRRPARGRGRRGTERSSGGIACSPLRLGLQGVGEDGTVDLGEDGTAVVCRAASVSFSLRTTAEQEALVAGFARYLNSLEESVQVLVRSERVELDQAITALEEGAGSLSSLALEEAALGHARFLSGLSSRHDLLRREVLLVLHSREPAAASGGAGRLWRRCLEAESSLEGAGVRLEVLEGPAAFGVLASCLEPFGATLPPAQPTLGTAQPTLGTPGTTVRRGRR